MVRRRVTVNQQGYAYLPKSMREEGYTGELDALPNHFTVTLVKPGATLRQVRASLEVILHDISVQLGEEDQNTQLDEESPDLLVR